MSLTPHVLLKLRKMEIPSMQFLFDLVDHYKPR